MEVTGKLHVLFDTQEVSASFKKREFVLMIADNPQYPQYVQFQLTQEKCVLLDAFQVGADITVLFNLRGRAWTNPQGETKYFNQLEAWKVSPANGQTTPQRQQQVPHVNAGQPIDIANTNGDDSDLPF